MKLHVKLTSLVPLFLLGFTKVSSSSSNKDEKIPKNHQHMDLNDLSFTYSDDFKNALRQFKTYIKQETENIGNISNDDQDDAEKNEDVMKVDGYDFPEKEAIYNNNLISDDFSNTIFFDENKRPFVLGGGFKFGKRLSRGENLLGAEKRPFILGGGYKFGKRLNQDIDNEEIMKRPFVLGGGYNFGKRTPESNESFETKKRPFVLGGGYRLGKRHLDKENFIEERKRPFVLGGGRFQFGKRALTDGNTFEEEKRPFVFSSFGKRDSDENSSPSVNNPFEYVDTEHYSTDRNSANGLKNKGMLGEHDKFDMAEESHVSKRPFIMGGGFSRLRKKPYKHVPTIRKHPMFVGSGFRFGKRNGVKEDQDDSQKHFYSQSHDRNNVFNEEDDEREDLSPYYTNEHYTTEKRPFIIQGLNNLAHQQPLFVRGSWKPSPINELGFQPQVYTAKEPLDDQLDILEKRPFVTSFGKRDRQMIEDYNKRILNFRHDYHFDRLRQTAKSNIGKRPFILESFGKRFDQNNFKYAISQNDLNEDDINDMHGEVSEGNEGNYEILNLPFKPVKTPLVVNSNYKTTIEKRPFSTGGYYKSRIGKRPFLAGAYYKSRFGKRPFMTGSNYRFKIGKRPFMTGSNYNLMFGKRPFSTGGNYRAKIGKRPFVFNGSRSRYTFGK